LLKKSLAIGIIFFLVISSVSYSTLSNEISTNTFGGNILYVGGSGPGNYSIIQDAINDASDGDTIFVYSGTYYENLIVDKTINLVGENRNTVIIDCYDNGDAILIKADWITIKGFTITGCDNYDCRGLLIIDSKYANILENIITSEFEVGIFLFRSSDCSIYYSTITDDCAIGIKIEIASNIEIFENSISKVGRIGISVDDCSNCIIRNNNISSPLWDASYGILLTSDLMEHNNRIVENILDGFDSAILVVAGAGISIHRNTIKNSYQCGIFLVSSGFNTITENDFISNEMDFLLFNCLANKWNDNYWGRPRVLPKPIKNSISFYIFNVILIEFTVYGFDWHPSPIPNSLFNEGMI